jgi:hypothetical protein
LADVFRLLNQLNNFLQGHNWLRRKLEWFLLGLQQKHAVAPWEPSQHSFEDRGKPEEPVSRWPFPGPSGCILTSSQQFGF